MIFKEFGEKSHPSVLLVEGEAVQKQQECLSSELLLNYHIIVPVLDGSEANTQQQADTVLNYVRQREAGSLYAICGTSKSWKLIRNILKSKSIHSGKVIIENEEAGYNHLIYSMLKEFALEGNI